MVQGPLFHYYAEAFCSSHSTTSHRSHKGKANKNKDKEEAEEEDDDLFAKNYPAYYVQTLEIQVFTSNPPHLDVLRMPSPRLFHTHLPFKAFPECFTSDSSSDDQCKIVYITLNLKDTIISMLHFLNNLRTPEQGPYPLEKAFESFCNRVCHFGQFFEHVLEYWSESLKMPYKILFLKYEDMKREANAVEVKRLTAFLGRPFEEEEKVEEVIRRCSLERLKNLEVNKNGIDPWVGMPNRAFFFQKWNCWRMEAFAHCRNV